MERNKTIALSIIFVVLLMVGTIGFLGWYNANSLLEQEKIVSSNYAQDLEKIQDELANAIIVIDEQEAAIQSISETNYSNLTIEQMFRIAAQQYGIDFKLMYAIAIHETGNFTSNLFLNHNNPGGIKSGGDWAHYATRFEGIMGMARTIYNGYWSQGMTTPEAMQPKYCPNSDTWAPAVRSLMERIH